MRIWYSIINVRRLFADLNNLTLQFVFEFGGKLFDIMLL
jgi:hypothetical protein